MNFVTTILAALRQVGYEASEQLAAQVALLLTSDSGMVKTMLLDGPAGAGKTSLAKAVARILDVPYIYIQAHSGSGPDDFLCDANIVQILRGVAGDRDAVRSAEDVIDLGFLPMVFRASQMGPVVAFVDELDKANPKTDSLFLSALQEGEVVIQGLGRIQANLDNLILFFTKNNEREISEPLMRRCRREYLGFPAEDLEMAILTGKVKGGKVAKPVVAPVEPVEELPEAVAKVLVTVANRLRARQEDLRKPPATQELLMAGEDAIRLVRWGVPNLVGEVAFGWLAAFQEDRQVLRGIITPDALRDLLVAAVRSSGVATAKQTVVKPDDTFVRFGT